MKIKKGKLNWIQRRTIVCLETNLQHNRDEDLHAAARATGFHCDRECLPWYKDGKQRFRGSSERVLFVSQWREQATPRINSELGTDAHASSVRPLSGRRDVCSPVCDASMRFGRVSNTRRIFLVDNKTGSHATCIRTSRFVRHSRGYVMKLECRGIVNAL